MHPYRGIVHMERRSDGISMIPDGPNTLTFQSADTNDTPRDHLPVLVTWGGRHNKYLFIVSKNSWPGHVIGTVKKICFPLTIHIE